MDSIEREELLTALQERKKILLGKFDDLADSGDNISAKGVKKQIAVIRKLIRKVYNGNIIIKEKKPESPDLDLHKQRDILLDLVQTLYKELEEEKLRKSSNSKEQFLREVKSKIQEIEDIMHTTKEVNK